MLLLGHLNAKKVVCAQKKTMPLLFYVASILLTAPVASTDNERANSVGGRIVSKTRCSLVGESVDRNTTGYIWLRKRAAQKAEELNAKGYKQEDLEDHPSLVALVFEEEDPQEEEVIVLEEKGEAGSQSPSRGIAVLANAPFPRHHRHRQHHSIIAATRYRHLYHRWEFWGDGDK